MNYLKYPPSIDWELTSSCNHNCIHCYNYWRGLNSTINQNTSSEYYENIAKKIVQAKPVSVQITGGEPLLVWQDAKKAIQYLINHGINVSINTNATLVTEEIAEFLFENNMDAFVSFPCCDSTIFENIVHCKGAFKRADRGIRILLDHHVRVSLNMVVTKINYPYVYDTALYVKEKYKVSYFSATKASFPQNATDEFKQMILNNEEFNHMLKMLIKAKSETGMRVDSAWVYSMCGFSDLQTLKQFGFNRKCGCGRYNFVVDSLGNMKACGCDSKSYGNIMKESFETAIARMNIWQNGELLPQKCRDCSNLVFCGGGCRSDAYSTHGIDCMLDSTASDLPFHLNQIHNDNYSLSSGNVYCLNPKVNIVQENNGVRLSYKTNYSFISSDFLTFIQKYPSFSLDMIRTASGNSSGEIEEVINSLLSKRILIETPGDESISVEAGLFKLLLIPYTDGKTPSFVVDYVQDKNKRYFNKTQ